MYCAQTVKRTLDRLATKGVYLTYHTFDEVERMNASLAQVWALDSESGAYQRVRELTQAEVAWINNETLLCRIDFRYWVDRYVWIKDNEDHTVKMTLWRSQEIFMDIIGEMEWAMIAIMMIILKARQLGLSRIISLIILHSILFSSNVNAFMASSTENKTRLLFDMADFCLQRLPWWMYREDLDKKFRRENQLLELHNGSAITLQHGAQTSGIARGTTPTVGHISELAEFEKVGIRDPGSLIDSSLLRAMHDSPTTKLFLEGTAEGQNNWWHDKWKSSKAGWPEGRSRLRPLFLPWFVGGLYPLPTWLRAHPIPPDYKEKMLPWALEHSQMAAEYVRNSETLSRHLGPNWEMPIEQIWYYECERDAAIRERRLNKFLQEMPANDDEAFQSTNISVFDTETITYYRDKSHSNVGTRCYGLRGPSEYIPERFQPSPLMINPNLPSIDITCAWGTGYPIRFTLVPLRFEGWTMESDMGGVDKIYLWEDPQPNEVYGLGVDTGYGIGKDRTVIEIIRKGNMFNPARQVGEFASSMMGAVDAAPYCLALGTHFSVVGEDGMIQQPRMAIEHRGGGDQTTLRLRMHGWHNFHHWIDRQSDNKQIQLSNYNKLGIHTDYHFRRGMIDMLTKMLRDLDIEICSPFFVQEMTSLEAEDIDQSIRAGYGGHDDRIMALGFILVSLYKFDINFVRNVAANVGAYHGRGQKQKERTYAKYVPGLQERA